MLGKRHQIQRTTSMSQLSVPPHTRIMEEVQVSPSSRAAVDKPKSSTNAAASKQKEGSPSLMTGKNLTQLQTVDVGVTAMMNTDDASMKKMDRVQSTPIRNIDHAFNTSMKMVDEPSTPIQMNVDDILHEEIQRKPVALPQKLASYVHLQALRWPQHMRPPSHPGKQEAAESFLQACFYCKRRLKPGRDIYMYRGDAAFCTEECRLWQISCDEGQDSMCSVSASQKGGPSISTVNSKSSRKAVSAVAA